MLDVIQFIVDSSGCKSTSSTLIVVNDLILGKITTEMFEQMKYSEIISQLTKNFAEESGDYPLIISTPAYKRFKVVINYNLVTRCSGDV